jgi:hypothetical protein
LRGGLISCLFDWTLRRVPFKTRRHGTVYAE